MYVNNIHINICKNIINTHTKFKKKICFYIVCEKMTYGLECALKCGECRDGTSCHHVNGTCTHGCADGLYGDMCEKGLNIQMHLTENKC